MAPGVCCKSLRASCRIVRQSGVHPHARMRQAVFVTARFMPFKTALDQPRPGRDELIVADVEGLFGVD